MNRRAHEARGDADQQPGAEHGTHGLRHQIPTAYPIWIGMAVPTFGNIR
jgi:hypothetical protein